MEVLIGLVLIVTTGISTVSVLQWMETKTHQNALKDAKYQYELALEHMQGVENRLNRFQKDLDDCKLILNMRSK